MASKAVQHDNHLVDCGHSGRFRAALGSDAGRDGSHCEQDG